MENASGECTGGIFYFMANPRRGMPAFFIRKLHIINKNNMIYHDSLKDYIKVMSLSY